MNSERRALSANAEAGFLMPAVIAMMTILLIGIAVAAPIMARQMRRDKEVESEHRMQQYVRAIRLYYRKTKGYPGSIEQLQQTNNVRFLRQKYVDPLTGKDDYRLIHVGQNKTQVSVAFGEPLEGIAGTGLGSAAGMQSTTGNTTTTPGTASTTVSGSGLSAGFNGATIGGTTGSTSSTGSTSTDPLGGAGGGPIMGVGTSATGSSILDPNQQDTYENWEFLYDPRIELLYQKGLQGMFGMGGTSATSLGNNGANGLTNGTGTTTGTGTSTSTGTGTTPGGTSPTPPQ